MQNVNPYAAPQSNVGSDDSVQYADVKVFSFSGRIGRIRYLAYSMGLMLVITLALAIFGAMAPVSASTGEPMVGGVIIGITVVAYLFIVVVSFTLAVRRLNDFDSSGWVSLLFLVPVLNAILAFALWLIPGTKGSNRFGLQPPPNGGLVMILGLLLPIIMVVGILAAIAIPSYQQYVERAAEVRSQ